MKNYFYVIVRAALGGVSNSISRLVVNAMPLYPFLFIRHFLIMVLSLGMYLKGNILKEDLKVIKSSKSIRFQIIFTALLSGIGTALFYNALKMLPVSIVSVFENGIYALFTVILGFVFLKEKLKRNSPIYLAICFIGLSLIVTEGNFSMPDISIKGISLLTLNAFMSAVGITITAVTLKKVSAIGVTTIKSVVAMLVALLLVVFFKQSIVSALLLISIEMAAFIIYGVISGYLIKYLQNRSVQVLNSSKTAIFQLLTPLLSSFFGMVIFGDWFNGYQYIGMLLILFSLYKLK